jgi:hypothetical protein
MDFAVNVVSFQELNLSQFLQGNFGIGNKTSRVKTIVCFSTPPPPHTYMTYILPPGLALGPVVRVEDAHLPDLLVQGEGGLVMGLYQGGHSIVVQQK